MSLIEAFRPDDEELMLFCMEEAYNATCERLSHTRQCPTPDTCAFLKRITHLLALVKNKRSHAAKHPPASSLPSALPSLPNSRIAAHYQ